MTYEMKCFPGDEDRIEVTQEFIKQNNFKIDKRAAERIMKLKTGDYFGFKSEVALQFLPFRKVKQFLCDDYVAKVEKEEVEFHQITDVMEAVQDFLDYMVFAWMKADEGKGLSASRSIDKLSAWMMILSRPDVAKILQDYSLYSPYGKPALRKACEILGINCPDYI